MQVPATIKTLKNEANTNCWPRAFFARPIHLRRGDSVCGCLPILGAHSEAALSRLAAGATCRVVHT